MARNRLIVTAALAALGIVLGGGPSGAASPLPTCWGEAITLPPGTLVGTAGDDVMLGTAGDEVIKGLGGSDTICGGGGLDKIYGGAGFDKIRGDDGNDRLYGGGGCDWLQGGGGDDLLVPDSGGGSCAGTAEGGSGRDRFLIDESGDNELFGGLGVDTLDLRHSPSPMTVGFAPGHYDSEPGSPPVGSLFWQIENVFGSAFDDYLYGDEKNNRVLGSGGDDDLYGRGGDDYLAGGDGFDYLNGGDGWDACWQWEIAGVDCEN